MPLKKLRYEDAIMLENIIDKLNEIVDYVNGLEEHYDRRIGNHWKYHRMIKDKEGGKD